MIPKKIHYFWFGRGPKSELEKECISRFAKFAPGAEIIEWDEDSFDVSVHPYTQKAYIDKKWAFVSDYARLKVLHEQGGIYLDTDMYLVRDISELFAGGSFVGKEDSTFINAAIFGAVPGERFVKDVLDTYNSLETLTTIPRVMTGVYLSGKYDITIFEKEYFYPFSQKDIHTFDRANAPTGAFGVHMWNYSWGNPYIKKYKQTKLYTAGVMVADILRIKKILKKILKII